MLGLLEMSRLATGFVHRERVTTVENRRKEHPGEVTIYLSSKSREPCEKRRLNIEQKCAFHDVVASGVVWPLREVAWRRKTRLNRAAHQQPPQNSLKEFDIGVFAGKKYADIRHATTVLK
jgi:hypothetical protein